MLPVKSIRVTTINITMSNKSKGENSLNIIEFLSLVSKMYAICRHVLLLEGLYKKHDGQK